MENISALALAEEGMMFFNTDHFWAFYWFLTEEDCWEEIIESVWFF